MGIQLNQIKSDKLRQRIQEQIERERTSNSSVQTEPKKRGDSCQTPCPNIELPIWTVPLATPPREEENAGRILVRIVSRRRRLADEDGLCPKWFIDAAKYAGFFEDDDPKTIRSSVSQIQVATKEEEQTEVFIEYPQKI